MKHIFFLSLIFSLFFSQAVVNAAAVSELPVDLSDKPLLPLYENIDANLQAALTKRLNQNPTWGRLIKQKKMAVALVDLTDLERPRFARVNGRQTMYAASMPKIAILLAAFQKIEAGELALTPDVKKDLTVMIRRSSNSAATRMIDRVGGLDNVNAVLTDPRYKLYDQSLGGGFGLAKDIRKRVAESQILSMA